MTDKRAAAVAEIKGRWLGAFYRSGKKKLTAISPEDEKRLIDEAVASGRVTQCPPRFLLPSQQGAVDDPSSQRKRRREG
jgi:hypothetical protein